MHPASGVGPIFGMRCLCCGVRNAVVPIGIILMRSTGPHVIIVVRCRVRPVALTMNLKLLSPVDTAEADALDVAEDRRPRLTSSMVSLDSFQFYYSLFLVRRSSSSFSFM
eukprot:gb/GEZN01012832.1/.p2 GENE.gb/GEZN01012832.1/~~gb/GEZN01012832.1/.p2  ORF type:complete len:110 (-),score=5.15 gb/GEZN01012832.1/:582-911(-)